MRARLLFVLLLGWAFSTAAGPASAQNISVAPNPGNFGDVEVGESVTVVFTLTSLGPVPLTLFDATIEDDPLTSFFVTFPGSQILSTGEFYDLPVMFSPLSLGSHSAVLNISSNAVPPDNDIDIVLQGTGVEATAIPEPPVLWLLVLGLASLALAYRWTGAGRFARKSATRATARRMFSVLLA